MSVIAQRQPADRPGPDIVSSALTTDEAKLERGRAEINYNVPDRVVETGSILELGFVRPGEMAQIQSKGVAKNGVVTSFAISGQSGNTVGNITVEVLK